MWAGCYIWHFNLDLFTLSMCCNFHLSDITSVQSELYSRSYICVRGRTLFPSSGNADTRSLKVAVSLLSWSLLVCLALSTKFSPLINQNGNDAQQSCYYTSFFSLSLDSSLKQYHSECGSHWPQQSAFHPVCLKYFSLCWFGVENSSVSICQRNETRVIAIKLSGVRMIFGDCISPWMAACCSASVSSETLCNLLHCYFKNE